ncbi:MAG: hypothetical protein RBS22_11130, partial [Spongiibacteraceae bacterium]|nr:hypothetical protein [Spongiibacteraceae bacterium]
MDAIVTGRPGKRTSPVLVWSRHNIPRWLRLAPTPIIGSLPQTGGSLNTGLYRSYNVEPDD